LRSSWLFLSARLTARLGIDLTWPPLSIIAHFLLTASLGFGSIRRSFHVIVE
jgi:hypothetical protein